MLANCLCTKLLLHTLLDLQEIFKDGIIPKVEGELYFKDGKKAGWRKYYFGIRTSGFYMSKSGKSMVCTNLYCNGWVLLCRGEYKKF